MRCPNCQALDPTPPLSDNGTTTCPRCGHRFPVDETMVEAQQVLDDARPCLTG
jgi:uncharacterized Zn finger protein (UPF0148 family)